MSLAQQNSSEALFSVLSPKNSEYEKKTLKTELKKLSLSEGRAYKFLQKFGEKKSLLSKIPKFKKTADFKPDILGHF